MAQYRDNPNMNSHEFDDYDDHGDGRSIRGGGGGGGGAAYNNASGRVHPLQNGNNGNHHAVGESQKLTVDFDAFTSDAEKLSAILKCADVEQHKHTLSVDYFKFRKYLLLLPIVIMSLTIAICGFVAASNIVKDHMKIHDSTVQDFLTMLVASFGFLVLLLTLLGNGLDYTSKVRFHSAAKEDLSGLCDKVRLYRMERAMDERAREEDDELKELFPADEDASTESDESEEEDDIPPAEQALVPHAGNVLAVKRQVRKTKKVQKRQQKLTKKLVKQNVQRAREEQELAKDVITFYGYHTELHQISRGCRSDVPPQISKFFHVMENRVELMSLSRLGVEEESRMRKNQIVRLCANEIYNEISNYWGWPLLTPSVDSTIEVSLKRVGQLLNMNYRAQRRCKLIPCCPIPLCCKKKTTNNVFAIINEGIDQRELDMMQAERTEVVKMENERRARRLAGPEEVLEMRDSVYSDGGGGRRDRERDSVSRREPNGSRAAAAVSVRPHPEYYAPEDKSRMSRDPEGVEQATEASYSFRAGGNAGGAGGYAGGNAGGAGGYASNHYNQYDQSRGVGGGGSLYPQDRSVGQQSYGEDADGMMTLESGTYAGTYASEAEQSYLSYDEEMGTAQGASEDEEGTKNAEKKKKKKKKKSKKKKKKKSKSKKKEDKEVKKKESFSEDDYSEYSEEEFSDEGFTEDDFSEYSEEE